MNFKQTKYVFKKPFQMEEGTIPQGSEIIIFRDIVYLNGGMIHPAYQRLLRDIVENHTLRLEYLKEVSIINNKI